jgi:transcription elongation factor Elf1
MNNALLYRKIIEIMKVVLRDENAEVLCPRCRNKKKLIINQIDLTDHFIRSILCNSCGLYEEILVAKQNGLEPKQNTQCGTISASAKELRKT